MIVLRLALQSLANRRSTALLTVLAIALSVALLLAVEKVRTGARQSFADTIYGTDLIVGARSGPLNLLLYSIFRIGNATSNMSWQSYQEIAGLSDVAWSVPLSLGDNYKGFRVLGTTAAYFEHYRYRGGQSLAFADGKPFADLFDAVIGADVATQLGLRIGTEITLAHGLGAVAFIEHSDMPFRIVGILAKTGTPVDRTVHVGLDGLEAIHVGWEGGVPDPAQVVTVDAVRQRDLTPKSITAAMIGLKSRIATFKVQRGINGYPDEPLSAIIPGAALQELWSLIGVAETALRAVSLMVVATALIGMLTMILTTINERRREMAILRAVGAGPRTVLGLLVSEAGLLTLAGVVVGTALLYAGLWLTRPLIDRWYGLALDIAAPGISEVVTLAAIVAAGFMTGLIPAWRAYRHSLADGMMVRI